MRNLSTTFTGSSRYGPLREVSTASEASYDNPLADTSQIALPKMPGLAPSSKVTVRSESTSSEGRRAQLNRAISLLNTKIAFGQVATLATLSAILHSGVPMLLEHAPLTAFQVIAGFKAMDLISFVLKDRNRIHTMIKEPIPPVSLEKVERVRSILTPLCNAQKIREPHIYIDTSEEITAALLHSLGVTIVILSPQTVEKLNHAELKAVLAHEIQHVKPWFSCFEMLRSSLLSVAKPCVFVVAACLAFDLLSPQFGKLLAAPLAFGIGAVNRQIASVAVEIAYLYANRHKELKSDLNAVQATGDPEALISALEKLEGTDPQTEQYRILDRLGLLSHPNPKSRAKSIRSVFGSPEAANQDQV